MYSIYPPQWLEARGDNATCPVCKAAIDKEHLVPIYGRGNESQEDPRCVPQSSVIYCCY